MACANAEKVNTAEALLKEAGFKVSKIHAYKPSCFDVAARKEKTLVLIKVQSDMSCISPQESLELRLISENVQATSLFISERNREKPLEDDTVYSRFNVLAVTLKTFKDMVLRGIHPLIQAGPGGYYVEIDGEAVRRRREELGLSIGEVAEKVGISRRTLYGYERGTAKASVTAAYRLISALGAPVAKPVNIFEHENEAEASEDKPKRIIVKNRLVVRLFRKLLGYDIVMVRKAPFDFAISLPDRDTCIIGGFVDEVNKTLPEKVEEIVSLSKVVEARPLLVTDGESKPPIRDIQCIPSEELSKIKRPEELYKL
ncbi:helix-turn-helix domain-containing protein [Candidatus Bathyarchaeota archaeon]|nr:helix-turn-helix domain-containing protein [Candidatus Bathyarchaeota archaeon]